VLAAFWLVLPIELGMDPDVSSSDACLTLADRPPPHGEEAIAALERCLTVATTDVELIADLAGAYELANRPGDAEAAYARALAIDPEYADVHTRLAALLLKRGDAARARSHAEIALRLQPNRRAVQELIARASAAGAQSQ
jgi:tetratricopeptide (TPR) repeat protein